MTLQTTSSGRVRQAALAVIFASLMLGFTDNLVVILSDSMGLFQVSCFAWSDDSVFTYCSSGNHAGALTTQKLGGSSISRFLPDIGYFDVFRCPPYNRCSSGWSRLIHRPYFCFDLLSPVIRRINRNL